jgi:hypothetical protein
MSIKSILDALQINDSRQLQRIMTSALSYHFQMFCHISVDEVCRKIEKLLHIHELMLYMSFISFDKKKINFVPNIKCSCSPGPTFGEENTFHQCLILWGNIL